MNPLPLAPVNRRRGRLDQRVKAMLATAACLFLAACAHDLGAMRRTETFNAYRSAIRWNDFEHAAAFQNGVAPPRRATDKLRDIRVTGYDVVREREDRQRGTVHQTVTIRYHHLGDRVEKTIVDEQDWHYDEERGDWVVDRALPSFE